MIAWTFVLELLLTLFDIATQACLSHLTSFSCNFLENGFIFFMKFFYKIVSDCVDYNYVELCCENVSDFISERSCFFIRFHDADYSHVERK